MVSPHRLGRNSGSRHYPCVMDDVAMSLQSSDLALFPAPEFVGLRPHVRGYGIQRDFDHILRILDFPNPFGGGFLKKNLLATHIQNEARPWPGMILA